MLPREFKTPRDKRDELKTYRELALGRGLKTIRHRRRLQANGKQRVLGNGSTAQPYLAVDAVRYREIRLEVQRRLLVEARQAGLDLSVDLLLEQLRHRIEAITYTQMAGESDDAMANHLPLAALGRALTSEERSHFAASRAAEGGGAVKARRRNTCHTALDHVLGHIEQRQAHNPARYQTVWAQVVGPEAAQQTHLERIDESTQTAYFRCFNSVLSSHLQRRAELPQKLARALGVPVRRLRAQF